MDLLTILLVTILNFVFVLYVYYKYYVYNYWTRNGVQCVPGSFPWGSLGDVMRKKIGFTEQLNEYYFNLKNDIPYGGVYFMQRKVLLVTHPDFAKNILSTDFKNFHNRGLYYDEKNEPLSAHLVALSGEKWKKLRTKITPTFTPNKLKGMFEILLECANEMIDVIRNETSVDIKDIAARYTTDVVGSTAFGIDCNSLKNPNAEFREVGKLATTVNQTTLIKRIIFRNFPSLGRKLRLKILHPVVSRFFMSVVTDMVEYRIKNDTNRKDFLQLLIEMMDRVKEDDALSIKQIAAQCFVFFIAGVETSASTITFALFELSKNSDMQTKLRDEILNVSKKFDGKLTYECISEMAYMEKVVLETMRKYPAFTIIMRRCTEDYQLPMSKLVLEKETPVCIPVYAIHHDPEYYPDPKLFDPERFCDEEMKKRNNNAYIPFGDGPRICLGRRFAMFQVKLALAKFVTSYKFCLNEEKSESEVVLDPNGLVLTAKNPIYLNIEPISI